MKIEIGNQHWADYRALASARLPAGKKAKLLIDGPSLSVPRYCTSYSGFQFTPLSGMSVLARALVRLTERDQSILREDRLPAY